MAITWTPTTTPLNFATKEATISATRLEAVDTDNPTDAELVAAKTFVVSLAPLQTNDQKLAVVDELWAAYQASITKAETKATMIDEFNVTLKSLLEAKEV